MKLLNSILTGAALALVCCSPAAEPKVEEKKDVQTTTPEGAFQSQLDFLKRHTEVVELTGAERNTTVVVCPAYQGRVLTSTLGGPSGRGLGWINRSFIESGRHDTQFNNYGGEDRFWLGPEAGQYGLFFKAGDPFDIGHWVTPAAFNDGAFDITRRGQNEIAFKKEMTVTNRAGTVFDLSVERTIQLLDAATAAQLLATAIPPGVSMVAFATDNKITNTSQVAWTRDGGLVSVWILGQFQSSPQTTVVLPYSAGPEERLGPVVNDGYFGKIPADRLRTKEGYVLFKADGNHRSKLGISARRAKPVLGSYDAANRILTIVQFKLPKGATGYVNSMWEQQKQPYAGDVVNSYNDGPTEPGRPAFGSFYELETSSPAAALKPSQSLNHIHRTFHFQGSVEQLDPIAKTVLGISLQEVQQ